MYPRSFEDSLHKLNWKDFLIRTIFANIEKSPIFDSSTSCRTFFKVWHHENNEVPDLGEIAMKGWLYTPHKFQNRSLTTGCRHTKISLRSYQPKPCYDSERQNLKAPTLVRLDRGVMITKVGFNFFSAPEQESHHWMQFSFIPKTHIYEFLISLPLLCILLQRKQAH